MLDSKGFKYKVESGNSVRFVMLTTDFVQSILVLPQSSCILDVGWSVDLAISSCGAE